MANIPPPVKLHETCDYCGRPLNAKSPKKRFCGDVCRIYYGRRLKAYGSPETQKEVPVAPQIKQPDGAWAPKDLKELKDLCPYKSGVERTLWIAEERAKFNL